jgi:ribonuclease HII
MQEKHPQQPKPARTASLHLEHSLLTRGFRVIAGVDEVGRGAWAGPVVAGAVCLPLERDDLAQVLNGVRDSKQLSRMQRERMASAIQACAVAWAVGEASHAEIDHMGIVPATCVAMRRALAALRVQLDSRVEFLLLDKIRWVSMDNTPFDAIVRGDQESLSIAAASVLAKVHRDSLMTQFDAQYQGYAFASNKGYGTVAHQRTLAQRGVSPIHRMSFAPMRVTLL